MRSALIPNTYRRQSPIIGWDIGGVNVKGACLEEQVRVVSLASEIWREKDRLPDVLLNAFAVIRPRVPPKAMAVTMTAELSDVFATKREGVLYLLQTMINCFPDVPAYALSLWGEFVLLSEARTRPLDFAAANWVASALWVSKQCPNCVLLDIGSTTTDIIPIVDGKVNVSARTDLDRLSSGELVYTGVLRTNLATIVQSVPVAGRLCRVASEYFAVSGDVHLILGSLRPEDYVCTTPDGRPPSLDSARKRVARLVCADTEMLPAAAIEEIARYVYARQIGQIRDGLEQVISRLPMLRNQPAFVLGMGSFLGAAAVAGMGLEIRTLAGNWGQAESAAAPSLAAAFLLAEQLGAGLK